MLSRLLSEGVEVADRTYDIRGVERVPEVAQKFLVRIGGLNPYGEPNYRLLYAHTRYVQVAGEFNEWDPNIPVEERCAFKSVRIPLKPPKPIYATINGSKKVVSWQTEREVMVPTGNAPLRVWMGVKEVPRYTDFKGVILEKWYPAHCYGTQEAWSAFALRDGTPVLGPYPERGDYEGLMGPWQKVPTFGTLDRAVSYVEQEIFERTKESPETHIRKRVNHAYFEAERASEKNRDELQHYIKDRSSFLLHGSLEAGRLRTHFAERAGLRHHVGN